MDTVTSNVPQGYRSDNLRSCTAQSHSASLSPGSDGLCASAPCCWCIWWGPAAPCVQPHSAGHVTLTGSTQAWHGTCSSCRSQHGCCKQIGRQWHTRSCLAMSRSLRYLCTRMSRLYSTACHCTLYVNSAESPSFAACSTSLEMSTCVTASLLGCACLCKWCTAAHCLAAPELLNSAHSTWLADCGSAGSQPGSRAGTHRNLRIGLDLDHNDLLVVVVVEVHIEMEMRVDEEAQVLAARLLRTLEAYGAPCWMVIVEHLEVVVFPHSLLWP